MSIDPTGCFGLMEEIGKMLDEDIIRPIDVIRTFDIGRIGEAFLHFGEHSRVGKIVLTYEDRATLLEVYNAAIKTFSNL